ncbi:MAG: hypothetical protein KF899_02630 [Parvibaculum sp.]|nr:hypothetical protein [Parvibaculum sp.]
MLTREKGSKAVTSTSLKLFRELERIGRIRLSPSFFLRDFLHSEIAQSHGMINKPDDLNLAVENGTRLCVEILEPLQKHFGTIRVRSGYRSAELNAFGHAHGLKCASNSRNYAAHIWDHLDAHGNRGASACVVLPALMSRAGDRDDAGVVVAGWASEHLPFDRIMFFRQCATFNIGWRDSPRRIIIGLRKKVSARDCTGGISSIATTLCC